MNNFRYKLAQLFAGRTGVDALGKTFTWIALLLMLVTMFTHSNIAYLLAMACLIYSIWRMFSKNYQKRYYENQNFLQKTSKIRYFFMRLAPNIKNTFAKARYDMDQRRTYKIFRCPSCKQKLRVPRGRGKIQVTCSKCRTQFIKKV